MIGIFYSKLQGDLFDEKELGLPDLNSDEQRIFGRDAFWQG